MNGVNILKIPSSDLADFLSETTVIKTYTAGQTNPAIKSANGGVHPVIAYELTTPNGTCYLGSKDLKDISNRYAKVAGNRLNNLDIPLNGAKIAFSRQWFIKPENGSYFDGGYEGLFEQVESMKSLPKELKGVSLNIR